MRHAKFMHHGMNESRANNFRNFVNEKKEGKRVIDNRTNIEKNKWNENFYSKKPTSFRTKRRRRKKNNHLHSSIFHETTFSILAIETENWNCLLKKMRPIRPVNLSQARLCVITAYCSNRRPITRTYTRRCENTRDTFNVWTQRGKTIQSRAKI